MLKILISFNPLDDVIAIFKAASIQYVVQTSEDAGTSVIGYTTHLGALSSFPE
jgi:hypothetical protein